MPDLNPVHFGAVCLFMYIYVCGRYYVTHSLFFQLQSFFLVTFVGLSLLFLHPFPSLFLSIHSNSADHRMLCLEAVASRHASLAAEGLRESVADVLTAWT